MDDSKDLWRAVGQLHLARHELIEQLAEVTHDESHRDPCSFCGEGPPAVQVIIGSQAAICARCVDLCREILDIANRG